MPRKVDEGPALGSFNLDTRLQVYTLCNLEPYNLLIYHVPINFFFLAIFSLKKDIVKIAMAQVRSLKKILFLSFGSVGRTFIDLSFYFPF